MSILNLSLCQEGFRKLMIDFLKQAAHIRLQDVVWVYGNFEVLSGILILVVGDGRGISLTKVVVRCYVYRTYLAEMAVFPENDRGISCIR